MPAQVRTLSTAITFDFDICAYYLNTLVESSECLTLVRSYPLVPAETELRRYRFYPMFVSFQELMTL